MLRKYGFVLIALSLVCVLSACGQKEKAEDAEAIETTEAIEDESVPQVVPGEMVLIPAGEFILGTDNKEHDTAYNPDRTMSLPAYWIDKYEVTNMEFMNFCMETGYMDEGSRVGRGFRLYFSADKVNFPAVEITYNDAVAYCKYKNKRLPTEEEWEKAGRGTEGFRYPWGNKWEDGHPNTWESGLEQTAPVGQFDDVSPFGVHDMLGNVQEWTSSQFKLYKGNPRKDPNITKTMRTVRGLGTKHRGRLGSIFERMGSEPKVLYDFGFRCARDATPEEAAEAQKTE